jgi:hypothetical protein
MALPCCLEDRLPEACTSEAGNNMNNFENFWLSVLLLSKKMHKFTN